jgi:hypothetical protein
MCWNKGRLYWKIAKLFYFCHLKKLVRPEIFGPTLVHNLNLINSSCKNMEIRNIGLLMSFISVESCTWCLKPWQDRGWSKSASKHSTYTPVIRPVYSSPLTLLHHPVPINIKEVKFYPLVCSSTQSCTNSTFCVCEKVAWCLQVLFTTLKTPCQKAIGAVCLQLAVSCHGDASNVQPSSWRWKLLAGVIKLKHSNKRMLYEEQKCSPLVWYGCMFCRLRR